MKKLIWSDYYCESYADDYLASFHENEKYIARFFDRYTDKFFVLGYGTREQCKEICQNHFVDYKPLTFESHNLPM